MSHEVEVRGLVRAKMAGRKADVAGFVDGLLLVAEETGRLRCAPAGDGVLRFEVGAEPPFEVELDMGRGKLRAACARLAVLCGEAAGTTPPLYGGSGAVSVPRAAHETNGKRPPGTIAVQLQNTVSQQEFTLTAPVVTSVSGPVAAGAALAAP